LHDTNWYISNNCSGSDHYWCVVNNGQAELQQRFGLNSGDRRWLVVEEVSAEEVNQSGGGGGNGWVLLSGHDADGAAGVNGAMNRWYGGMVHELGHAFGLPDSTSTDGTACPGRSTTTRTAPSARLRRTASSTARTAASCPDPGPA
jgi:hypothetical protein